MYSSLVFASLAASVAAQANLMALPQVKRDLAPRATESDALPTDASCATAALSLLGSLPTPPPAIVSDVATNPQTDPCSFSTPSGLSSAYSSYSSELLSWASDHEGDLSTILSECPQLSSYADQVPVCSTAVPGLLNNNASTTGGAGAGGASTPTKSSGPDSTESSGSASTPTHKDSGASRQTGVAAFALVAAGLIAMAL